MRSRRAVHGLFAACCVLGVLTCLTDFAIADDPQTGHGDELLRTYFEQQTRSLADRCLSEIRTASDLQERRAEFHRQLREMLGLDPWPERTPLEPVITGQIVEHGIVVEKLHFQSAPGLYVTGNLYRPETVNEPLPAVLYVCGHARVWEKGVAYGNKAAYQHHGAWLARNGYVCLTIDTIQLGEIEGLHHGTYRLGQWWWTTRGYTPAGVEAWNGIRALDYLETRAEVDPERIGMTGRSGGGAYTWWVAALDDRVQCAVPVAGITSMQNHIVDDCIEGHCDCMFMVNRYEWDFPLLAALVAPRPLLITNSDKDRIFPLDGVVDVYQQARRIYRLLDAEQNIGLAITEGPHKDTQPLQINAFSWLNRFLKKDDTPISLVAEKLFTPAELKVFDSLPPDERVTSVQDWFVPAAESALPRNAAELQQLVSRYRDFRQQMFQRWETAFAAPLDVELLQTREQPGLRVRTFAFLSEEPYRLTFQVVDSGADSTVERQRIEILDEVGWRLRQGKIEEWFSGPDDEVEEQTTFAREPDEAVVVFAPRGIGATEWTSDPKKRTAILRRFQLLGTTLDTARAFDTARALAAVSHALPITPEKPVELVAPHHAGFWLLLALGESDIPAAGSITLRDPSSDWYTGPSFLQVARDLSVQQLVLAAKMADAPESLLKVRISQPDLADQEQNWREMADSASKLDIETVVIEHAEAF